MDDYEFIKAMELISAALKESGYSVREQMEGYLLGGNLCTLRGEPYERFKESNCLRYWKCSSYFSYILR